MRLLQENYYSTNSKNTVDIINDIKFAFNTFNKFQNKHLSKIILFYIDGVNGCLSIGYAEEDSSFIGESVTIEFSSVMEEDKSADAFIFDIEASMIKAIFSIDKNSNEFVKHYYCNDGDYELKEVTNQ
jgi:hypothetical protein